MNQPLLLFYFIVIINSLSAQKLVRINSKTPICTIEGDGIPKDRFTEKASEEITKTIENICRIMGVSPNIFIVEAANVANAEALILEGKRYIYYSPFYINQIKSNSQTDWSMIYVLSHEIGHHANYHTLDTLNLDKRQNDELIADKFAGCALRHLGATLKDVEKAVNVLQKEGDTKHPPRSARMDFTIRGWEDCAPNSDIDPNPPIPKTSITKKTPPKDCAKTTGDIYFKNTTERPIRIHTSPQSGWYDQYHFITIDPGDTKGFLDLNVGRQAFAIRISSGGTGFEDYKNEEIRIEPCADESQQAIIIR